uniref:Uncharacterized protein n=1 Tax=Anguilla anguilla TaxID=7936 RepID=A0A0E9WRJ9_ANGAN
MYNTVQLWIDCYDTLIINIFCQKLFRTWFALLKCFNHLKTRVLMCTVNILALCQCIPAYIFWSYCILQPEGWHSGKLVEHKVWLNSISIQSTQEMGNLTRTSI